LTTDVLDHLGDAWVSSQAVVVVGAEDFISNVLIVREIEQPLLVKEVIIL